MRLRAFPALPASSCCLGSGDWPLDPHEVLLHPRDLEKLRLPAYGYVTVSSPAPDSNEDSGGGGGIDDPTTFCRVVPEDSLAPGESRAPVWILNAMASGAVGKAKYLTIFLAIPPRGKEVVVEPPTTAGYVTVALHRPRISEAGAQTARYDPVGESPRAEQVVVVSKHVDLGRAIARRCCGSLVRPGCLLNVEVLGRTTVFRVLSVSQGEGSAGRSSLSSLPDYSRVDRVNCPGGTRTSANTANSPHQLGRNDANIDNRGPFLIGPETKVVLNNEEVVSVAQRQYGGGDDVSLQRDRTTRFTVRCGGREEVWSKRAPGLETSIDELHALLLLAAGKLRGSGTTKIPCVEAVNGTRRPHHSANVTSRVRVADVLPSSIVVSGPSGTGKTLALTILAEDLQARHGMHVIRLLGPQILASFSQGGVGDASGTTNSAGESARNLLARALLDAKSSAPSIIVIDELDAVFDSMSEDGQGGGSLAEGTRAGAVLLAVLDEISSNTGSGVAVVGATRRVAGGTGGAGWTGLEEGDHGAMEGGAAIPSAFRKPGRFDRCVEIGPPTQAGREGILRVLLDVPGLALETFSFGLQRSKTSVDGNAESIESAVVSSPNREERAPEDAAERSNSCGRRGDVNVESSGVSKHQEQNQEALRKEWASRLSKMTPGMVGGDLERVIRTARARAVARNNSINRNNRQHIRKREGFSTPSSSSAETTAARSIAAASVPNPQQYPTNSLTWQDVMGAVAVTVPRSLQGMNVVSASGGGSGDANGGGNKGPTWASVGGFAKARRRLQRLVQWPWQHPEAFARMGISAPAGALLYGPSGCGKSLVAQVLANECLANFVWVRSSELLSRYLGETEAKLRALFARARAAAPCILFLDELDAITAKRGDGDGDSAGGSAGGVHARVLSTLLNEMDGVAGSAAEGKRRVSHDNLAGRDGEKGRNCSHKGSARDDCGEETSLSGGRDENRDAQESGREGGEGGGVLVLAATSRKYALDSALLRPGRLHESVEFGMPDKEDREGVLRVHVCRLPLAMDVDLERLSRDDVSRGLSCADLEASCRDAAMMAVREDLHGAHEVRADHLRKALEERVKGRLKTTKFTFSIGI